MNPVLLHTHSVMAYILVLVSGSMYVYLINLKVEAPGKRWFTIFYLSQIVWQAGDTIRYSIHPAYVGSLPYQLEIMVLFVPAITLVEIAYMQFLYQFVRPAFEQERRIVFYIMIAFAFIVLVFNGWNEFYNQSDLLLMQVSILLYSLFTNLWAMAVGWRKSRLFRDDSRAATGNRYMIYVNLCFVVTCFMAVVFGLYSSIGYWTFFILLWLGNLAQIVVSITYAAVPTSFQVKLVGFTFVMIATVLLIVTLVFYPPLYPTDYGPRLAQQPGLIKLFGLITFSTLGLVLILPRILNLTLTRPLRQLLDGVQRVNTGDLLAVVPVGLPDEIGDLTLNFNRMTQSLKKSQDALKVYTEQLEDQVAERTAKITAQKQELETHRDYLEKALVELKETQLQLIQKEKMASLGELTAGVAHEIQNPLNFVNNFSRIGIELLDELKEEINADHKEDAMLLTNDLTQNLQRIATHGQRADSIVKGMLQLSKNSSSSKKQATNLNSLAADQLQAAYQEIRTKDKTFDATLAIELDAAMKEICLVPQDMNRALFNIYQNAFYALNQRRKQAPAGYQPTVSVRTRLDEQDKSVLVQIWDNGVGMSETVLSKLYQPFFTTKPTGQGTGLGMSQTYTIVNQGHSGTVITTSEENQYTQVTLRLPISGSEK